MSDLSLVITATAQGLSMGYSILGRSPVTHAVCARNLATICSRLALASALLGASPAPVAAEAVCGLVERIPFAGHSFPLDSLPELQPMTAVNAFPNLVFSSPVFVTHAPDGSDRLFVVEQGGRIRVFPSDPAAQPADVKVFLDIDARVHSGGELGLLGLAFDPDYAQNGHFYVHYSATTDCDGVGLCGRVERFTRSASDPDAADPNSDLEILEFPDPASNHNGGMLAFGPDGMLYIAIGDGGGSGDPGENAENLGTLLGKILRIDPRGASPYAIPAGNPFAGDPNSRPEIWHYGLRNPWRFSFDRQTGDLWIGDVGQDQWEEIDFAPAGASGLNFGWDLCEGKHDYEGSCATPGLTAPVIEYGHLPAIDGGDSVNGGYVYRGDRLPQLFGAYVYGDYVSQRIWAWSGGVAPPVQIASLPEIVSFGEDRHGELYMVRLGGTLHQLEPAGPPGNAQFPSTLSATQLFLDTAGLVPAPGMIEYTVNSPLWSDGASKRRWMALPGQEQIDFHATEAWDFPVGTVFVKHFELPLGGGATRRVETRVLLHQLDRWIGYTYHWNLQQTDAQLLLAPLSENILVDHGSGPVMQTWNNPGPGQCLGCHTSAAGRVLGVRTRQLHRDFPYPLATDNQLHAWKCIGLFSEDIGKLQRLSKYADPADPNASLQRRARSYVAANCAICHAPGGPAPGGLDLRYAPLLGQLNAIDVVPTEGDLGLFDARRIKPGSKEQSVLWYRMATLVASLRMPKGSLLDDALAAQVVGDWIDTGLATLDSDEDTVPDAADNCDSIVNADQLDTWSPGGPGPDGVGNACQCWDTELDGDVEGADAHRIQLYLAGLPSGITGAGGHRRCPDASDAGFCTLVDAVRASRAALLGGAGILDQSCDAATEPAP